MARSRSDGAVRSNYLLPTARWTPAANLTLDARPDLYGDYFINGWWGVRRDLQARVLINRGASLDLTHELNGLTAIGWSSHWLASEDRHRLYASRRGRGSFAWTLRGGPQFIDGDVGWGVGGNSPVGPGLWLTADYDSHGPKQHTGKYDARFSLSVVTELSHAQGRLVPARGQAFYAEYGSVAGRIIVPGAGAGYELSGIRVMVDGSGRTFTGAGGRFPPDWTRTGDCTTFSSTRKGSPSS